jgi:hypothetical protein
MFTPGRVRSFTMQKRQECVVNHRHEETVGRQEVSPGTRSFQFLGGVSARQTVPLCLCALVRKTSRSESRLEGGLWNGRLRGMGASLSSWWGESRLEGGGPCARHGHEHITGSKVIGRSDTNRSERQGGLRKGIRAKEVCSKGTTLGTRTGSEAAMRAMSVRKSAKSNCHRKTHRVEPEGAVRMFMHLTRGGPRDPRGTRESAEAIVA